LKFYLCFLLEVFKTLIFKQDILDIYVTRYSRTNLSSFYLLRTGSKGNDFSMPNRGKRFVS